MKRYAGLMAVLVLAMAAGGSPRGLMAQASSHPRGSDAQYLGDVYRDDANAFSIRPPAQWWLDNKSQRYAVMFTDRTYQAYEIVDVIKLAADAKMDPAFQKFITEKNQEVKDTIPSFSVLSNRLVRLGGGITAYRTEATFQAGPNIVLMDIYYILGKAKIFMITTVCPQATVRNWDQIFQASVNTFTPLD